VTISSSPSGASGDVTLDSYDATASVYLEQSAPPGPAVMAYLDAVAGLVGDGTVLELGSGPGWDARYLESRGPRVLRTDGALAFVQMLRAAGHQARLLDVRTDDFGGPYDAVLADAVLLHVPREQFEDVLQRARQAAIVVHGGPVRAGAIGNWDPRALLADLAVHEFADDVEVSDVPRVLLQEMEHDPLESGRGGAFPTLSWPPDVGQLVRPHDSRGDGSPRLRSTHQVRPVLRVGDVPATVLLML